MQPLTRAERVARARPAALSRPVRAQWSCIPMAKISAIAPPSSTQPALPVRGTGAVRERYRRGMNALQARYERAAGAV
jgi:hypothetical protein